MEIKTAVDLARNTQPCLSEVQLDDFNLRYDVILEQGLMANSPPEPPEAFCQIRSYISTARKNRQNIWAVLRLVFAGNPYLPAFVPVAA
jgi:hypothetical protein